MWGIKGYRWEGKRALLLLETFNRRSNKPAALGVGSVSHKHTTQPRGGGGGGVGWGGGGGVVAMLFVVIRIGGCLRLPGV